MFQSIRLKLRKDFALPHKRHEKIYLKLSAVTEQVRLALKEADPDVLMGLAQAHEAVAKDLLEVGNSSDPALLDQVRALSCQVSDVISEMHQCQQGISAQIKQISDGKKLVTAYVN
jgi:hypothetical protein